MWAATITLVPLSFGACDEDTEMDEGMEVEMGQQETARELWDDLGLPSSGRPLSPQAAAMIFISIQVCTSLPLSNFPQRISVLTLGQVICHPILMLLKL